jgi:hypothetical protein
MWFRKKKQETLFYASSYNLCLLRRVQFHTIEFSNTKTFLGTVTIFMPCQHFSSCADSNTIRNWLRDFLSVLQKDSAISFSHSKLSSKFQQGQSVFSGL